MGENCHLALTRSQGSAAAASHLAGWGRHPPGSSRCGPQLSLWKSRALLWLCFTAMIQALHSPDPSKIQSNLRPLSMTSQPQEEQIWPRVGRTWRLKEEEPSLETWPNQSPHHSHTHQQADLAGVC